jgi:hypothetical protein
MFIVLGLLLFLRGIVISHLPQPYPYPYGAHVPKCDENHVEFGEGDTSCWSPRKIFIPTSHSPSPKFRAVRYLGEGREGGRFTPQTPPPALRQSSGQADSQTARSTPPQPSPNGEGADSPFGEGWGLGRIARAATPAKAESRYSRVENSFVIADYPQNLSILANQRLLILQHV